ncbi:peptidoglycan-binding domain-containing protein [Devosia sp. 1566]|uniref:peptidoglycan-binding domain-containing protein n=1 Tax=Devosia sp. 1566 TaxID=2499144 RepID=UPI0013E400B2|nr:peptidoglycan-binding domain-containing protein [Devosia sp. 1566]
MTATTISRLPLLAGSAVATSLGRAGLWTLSRYMRAPLASTGLLALVTLTALAASNALYFQTRHHPAPFFGEAGGELAEAVPVPVPVAARPEPQLQAIPESVPQTTGTVSKPVAAPQVPDQPVGNAEVFELQKRLVELKLFDGMVDGYYGPRTARAIRAFEERNGMTPTGAMTRAVIEAILQSDSNGVASKVQPAAQVQPAPAPAPVAPVQVAAAQPQAQTGLPPLAPVAPVTRKADPVVTAAAQSIDSIVAAADGGSQPAPTAVAAPAQVAAAAPVQAPPAQPMPEPIQVASLEEIAPPAQSALAGSDPADQVMAATSLPPANNKQLVSQIQRGLASLGFFHAPIDGHPGAETAKAIREFENFHNYRVTGQVNPDLLGLLQEAGASI